MATFTYLSSVPIDMKTIQHVGFKEKIIPIDVDITSDQFKKAGNAEKYKLVVDDLPTMVKGLSKDAIIPHFMGYSRIFGVLSPDSASKYMMDLYKYEPHIYSGGRRCSAKQRRRKQKSTRRHTKHR